MRRKNELPVKERGCRENKRKSVVGRETRSFTDQEGSVKMRETKTLFFKDQT